MAISLIFALIVMLFLAGSAEAATLYADTTAHGASGTTCSNGSPCTVVQAVASASCGDTINLKNGRYQGANDMLSVSGKSCGSSTRLTIQAVQDGGVLFDGQSARRPCLITGSSYITLIGVDCAYSDTSSGTAARFTSSDHLIVQRVIGYDPGEIAGPGNNAVAFLVENTTDSLFEDSAAFGLSVEVFLSYGTTGGNNTYRRVWYRGEGSNDTTFKSACAQFNYTSTRYANPSLSENTIGVVGSTRGSLQCATNWLRNGAVSPYERFLGGIHYFNGVGSISSSLGDAGLNDYGLTNSGGYSGAIIRDTVLHAGGAAIRPANFGQVINELPKETTELTRVNMIYSTQAPSIHTDWTQTNVTQSTTVGGTGFDYLGTSNTAKLCYRYVDGVYTSTPLWPWPMDDRIASAIAVNSSNGSPTLAGTAGTGYAANTVTSEIVSMLGSIPAACSSSGFTPSFPVASDFPAVAVIDDFNRADSSGLGANWTNLLGTAFDIVSQQAAATASFSRAVYSAAQFTASHEVCGTWTTVQAANQGTVLSFAGTDLTVNNQYRVFVNNTGATATMEIIRVDGVGGQTTILGPVDLGAALASPNGFGVRVSGTTITMYWKWTDGVWYRTGTVVDSSLPTGMVYGGIAGVTPAVVNDFCGGPTSGTPSPPNPPGNTGVGRFGNTFPGRR